MTDPLGECQQGEFLVLSADQEDMRRERREVALFAFHVRIVQERAKAALLQNAFE